MGCFEFNLIFEYELGQYRSLLLDVDVMLVFF